MITVLQGYAATACGHIWSYKTEKRLVGKVDKNGYIIVNLRTQAGHKTYRRARLICEAYHGPCPYGYQVNHKNGVKSDDRPLNLEWVSASDNCKHSIKILMEWPKIKLTEEEVVDIKASPLTNKELSSLYNVHNSTISLIRAGKRRA